MQQNQPQQQHTLTPAQTQEAFADDAVSQAARNGHVGLPRLRQDPTERRQEEEMQERRHQRTHDLRETDGTRGQTFAIGADHSQVRVLNVLNIRIRVASPCCALASD